jgi:hypothetical protein
MSATWHVDATLLRRYRSDQLTDAQAASVEMHVTACPSCRALIATEGAAGPAAHAVAARVKRAIDERLDARRISWAESALRRLGVNDRDAGLVTATLSLHGSWLAACALVLAFAIVAAFTGPEKAGLAAFLVAAPLVPLAGVAVAFGPRVDPTYEIAMAASVPAARIILLRALAVTAPAVPVMLALSFLLPGGLLAFAWLLPAVGLASASLALGTIVPLHRAAIGLAAAWAIGAAAGFGGAPRTTAEAFVQGFAAFRPSGQLLSAAVAAASLVLAAMRRAAFETGR